MGEDIQVYLMSDLQMTWLWYWSLSVGCKNQGQTVQYVSEKSRSLVTRNYLHSLNSVEDWEQYQVKIWLI
jgi:hypothetical protein